LLERTFANTTGGLEINLDPFCEKDLIKILFAENPAAVIQVEDAKRESVEAILGEAGVKFLAIGNTAEERTIILQHDGSEHLLGIDYLRDVWFESSYLLDTLQSGKECAAKRFENYKKQPIKYRMPSGWSSNEIMKQITHDRKGKSGIKAAIIREKGVNGDREMAYSLHLAGFDVKDVHMTDLMSGRETLEDVNMIVFCGGFSNSDVLGSAKGWAGGFLWNDKAKETLKNYFSREDTLSLGICNGCQLMIELNLINPEHKKRTRMDHNISHKFESQFLGLTIPKNNSVMFGSLSGSKLGVWVAHGEGRFILPEPMSSYNVIAKYNYSEYPANPNGSRGAVAGLASADGRHLCMMPHLERTIFPWQCAYYPTARVNDEVTPWIQAFINAYNWVKDKTSK
ncbi:MAG: phosphoribosylformylglycinamidine synthase subunit PurQ, partial [Muribaculaceae bacterium]|nr:phosphoribosylformylglycinamidine synthase subunit PurQ [Muribaculaceae bacterium]